MKDIEKFWSILSMAFEAFVLMLVFYVIVLVAFNPTKAGAQLGKFRQGFDSIYYGRVERH